MKRQLAVIAIAASLSLACRISLEVGENVPMFGGTKLEVEFDPWGNRTAKIPPQPGLPAGTCVKVTFLNAAGEVIGSTETEVGESFDVPDGTKDAVPGPCDPPEEPEEPEKKKKNSRRASAPPRFSADQLGQFAYQCLPMNPAGGSQRYAEFLVTARSRSVADPIAFEFIHGMLDEPPPLGVEPRGVVQVQVEADSSVSISMFSVAPPQTLEFEWNGVPLYGLDEASVAHVEGWYVTTVLVPAALVDVDAAGAADNRFEYRLGLPSGAEVGTSVSVAVTP